MNYGLFYLGIVVGAALFGTMWWLSENSFRNYLVMKAKVPPAERTAVKLGDEFFYIITEAEYVELLLRPLRMRSTLGASPFEDRRVHPRPDHDTAPWGEHIKPGS